MRKSRGFRRSMRLCALASVLACPGRLATAQTAVQSDTTSCQAAAAAAELRWNIPGKLLSAIGIRESGRSIAGAAVVPWPWAIDADGRDSFADSKPAAVAQVQALQASGMQSIDVGCFQINLAAHPLAFTSLDAAFDPMTNGDYAGRFLASLHDRTGSWLTAVADYHSSTPPLGEAYRQRVFAEWLGPSDPALWAPPRGGVLPAPAAVRLASFRSPIPVWGPSGRMDAGTIQARAGGGRQYGMPRVITPTASP